MAMHEIHIDWTGPHTHEQVQAMNGKQDFGIYQLCGYHPVYCEGDEEKSVLLYIGYTERRFKSALRNHDFFDPTSAIAPYFNPSSVRAWVGRVRNSLVPLRDIRDLLIFAHSPAWNSFGIKFNSKRYRRFEVVNHGARGGLPKDRIIGKHLFCK